MALTAEENRRLLAGFDKPSSFVADGIHVGGRSYFYIRNTERTLLGKEGQRGVLVTRCNKCMVLGVFEGAPQLASVVVEPLADYLCQLGF